MCPLIDISTTTDLSATNYYLCQIAQGLQLPFYSAPEFWAVIVALAVAVLSPVYIDYLNRRPKKSNLLLHDVMVRNQDNDPTVYEPKVLDIGRLVITNMGKFSAKSVQAYIERISDDGERREDFIPMPLTWTHGHLNPTGAITRDIYPNQTVYLDVFLNVLDIEVVHDRSVLLSVGTGREVDSFSKVALGQSELKIRLYQESGQVSEANIKIGWDGVNVPTIELEKSS